MILVLNGTIDASKESLNFPLHKRFCIVEKGLFRLLKCSSHQEKNDFLKLFTDRFFGGTKSGSLVSLLFLSVATVIIYLASTQLPLHNL